MHTAIRLLRPAAQWRACTTSIRTLTSRSRVNRPARSPAQFPVNLHFIPPRDILVTAHIGTPPQNFRLLLDTGAPDTWVRSETLQPWEPGAKFHPLRSQTWQQTRTHWGITYVDRAAVEGVEGVERVRLGEWEVDSRVGVAEGISTVDERGRRIRRGKMEGIRAGTRGLPAIDGVLGVGLGGSFVEGLRGAGARGIKLEFRVGEEGRFDLKILRDTDGERGFVWYDVDTDEMDKKWEIGLKKILVGDTFSRVNRGQRVVL
jgi:Eukaryotic aspartyl protease